MGTGHQCSQGAMRAASPSLWRSSQSLEEEEDSYQALEFPVYCAPLQPKHMTIKQNEFASHSPMWSTGELNFYKLPGSFPATAPFAELWFHDRKPQQ